WRESSSGEDEGDRDQHSPLAKSRARVALVDDEDGDDPGGEAAQHDPPEKEAPPTKTHQPEECHTKGRIPERELEDEEWARLAPGFPRERPEHGVEKGLRRPT